MIGGWDGGDDDYYGGVFGRLWFEVLELAVMVPGKHHMHDLMDVR